MARLEIKGNAKTPSSLDIRLDGTKIEHLKSLKLSLAEDEFNHAAVSFYVDSVDIDPQVLADLQAIVQQKEDE